MKAIRVRNLRSFDHSSEQEYIELKPITVFIGKNSCGKSSLLRTFPLLRQSIEANTSGPILWYGQYVDYGAYSEAKNKSSEENSIFFDYKFDLTIQNKTNPIHLRMRNSNHPIELSLEVTEEDKLTTTKSVNIKIFDTDISIEFSPTERILVNGEDINISFFSYTLKNSLIPFLERANFDFNDLDEIEAEELNLNINDIESLENDEELDEYLSDLDELYTHNKGISRENIYDIVTVLEPIVDNKLYNRRIIEEILVGGLSLSSLEQLEYKLNDLLSLNRKLTRNELSKVHHNITVNYIPVLINLINEYFENYSKNIKYVAPLRATAERFYRFQDLRVEEIDHTGSNLAMLLRNLRKPEIKRFQAWSLKHFGFYVSVPETNSLHYEIKVTIDNQTQNISDMGFGFSQILPIVTTLWLETQTARARFRKNPTPLTFVLEQPELHLHPEYQSILAKVFSAIAQQSTKKPIRLDREINIIFETHSKTMIDSIGDYIEENNCPELANIYIFNKEGHLTDIQKSGFDEDGDLVNWPIGFFSGR